MSVKTKAKTYTNNINRSREIILLKVIFIVVVLFKATFQIILTLCNIFVKTRYSKVLVNEFKVNIIKFEWKCILIDIFTCFQILKLPIVRNSAYIFLRILVIYRRILDR